VSDWLKQVGFRKLTKEKEQQLNTLAIETIFNRVALILEKTIPADDVDTLQNLFDNGDFDSLSTFLTQRGVDLDNLIDEETEAYLEEMTQAGRLLEGKNG